MFTSKNLSSIARQLFGLILSGVVLVTTNVTSYSNNPDAIVKVRLPEQLSEGAQQGRKLFEKNCAPCHGKWGGGSANGPPLIHRIYEPNHHSDESFRRAAKNGVRAHHWPFGNMPPVPKATSEDVELIIEYIRAVQKENSIF